jgi:23S rRNA (cytidine1920-2'-O)/16S rRNA (cytidine1409-2'-O)-methyltransferase
MPLRKRADLLLVERGLFESRARAQAAIKAGLVRVGEAVLQRPSDEIEVTAEIEAQAEHPWVSRGALKLMAALDAFAIDSRGRVCLDVGASTGGFSEALLARGARRVYAVDVGDGQLHPRLRERPEIVSLEKTDIRRLDPSALAEPPSLIAIDVSFISLKLALPPALALASPRAELVALVKPQFEAGRRRIKKGVVRDPAVHQAVCAETETLVSGLGWTVRGVIPSPVAGGEGNREFLLGAARG